MNGRSQLAPMPLYICTLFAAAACAFATTDPVHAARLRPLLHTGGRAEVNPKPPPRRNTERHIEEKVAEVEDARNGGVSLDRSASLMMRSSAIVHDARALAATRTQRRQTSSSTPHSNREQPQQEDGRGRSEEAHRRQSGSNAATGAMFTVELERWTEGNAG